MAASTVRPRNRPLPALSRRLLAWVVSAVLTISMVIGIVLVADQSPRRPRQLRARSASLLARLSVPGAIVADLDAFGVPIFTADDHTPRYAVTCTKMWGRCSLERQAVPVPDDARPAPGSDGALVVVEPGRQLAYEFWRARKVRGRWTAAWGAVVDLTTDPMHSSATGSGISRLYGVVRASEIAAGEISHPLVFSSNLTCRQVFVPPATKTDGTSSDPGCIPEGTRLMLDPTISIDDLPGITSGERTVGHALQRYGAYCVDTGGAPVALIFERVAGNAAYTHAALKWDYFGLTHIPAAFRVAEATAGP